MSFLRRGDRRASALAEGPSRAGLVAALGHITYELIPLKNVNDQAGFLPAGATVSVTASPAKGLEATVELAGSLQERGFHAIPHLSARMVRDRAHLRDLLARLGDLGIDRAFVVGGDAEEPGEYLNSLSLLRAMADLGNGPRHIGIGCYPQGHPSISDAALEAALRDKAPFAEYMTTQLCFDPKAIARFIAARRAEGITLGLKVGVAGVSEIPKLISISARIGVKDSRRFLAKNVAFVGQVLASGGTYRPTGLLEKLAPTLADPVAGVIGLHIYTFNQVESTEAWRRELSATLSPGDVAAAS